MHRRPLVALAAVAAAAAVVALPSTALAGNRTGGLRFVDGDDMRERGERLRPGTVLSSGRRPVVAGRKAKLIGRKLYAPSSAPLTVKRAIWAGNRIHGKPYVYGGGHANFRLDDGYDCSGAVSYVLHHAKRSWLSAPRDANGFASFGQRGEGRWITVYVKWGHHAYMEVAGVRLDTTGPGPEGPRWRTEPRYDRGRGFVARHPAGL